MKDNLIKIFGERNTGTNYLVKLINQNFHLKFLRGTPTKGIHRLVRYNAVPQNIFFFATYLYLLGWKHAATPRGLFLKLAKLRNIGFITLSKNPYSWLPSMYKKPYQSNVKFKDFEDFLTYEWPLSFMDNLSYKKINTIQLWNLKNKSYIELSKNYPKTLILNYESLLENPRSTLQNIQKTFDLAQKEEFKNIENTVKWDTDKGFDYYKDYYLNEKWKDNLTQSNIETINKYLDKEVVEKLGYKFLLKIEN